MIAPLRRAHRIVFVGLAIVLPSLFVAGLADRPPQVATRVETDRITLRLPDGTEMTADAREMWGAAVDGPDLQVYWSPHAAPPGTLPDSARYIGSLAAAHFTPLDLPGAGGFLLLHSLARRQTVAAPAPEVMP